MILSTSEESESEWRLLESLSECLPESLLSERCESLRSELSLLDLLLPLEELLLEELPPDELSEYELLR